MTCYNKKDVIEYIFLLIALTSTLVILTFFYDIVYLDAGRENQKNAKKDLEKTEEDLKALQSVGQIIGEVLRPLDKERCK